MNWKQLDKAPSDLTNFIEALDKGSPELSQQNLRELVKQGISNIRAICFDVGIIQNIESELIANGYKVFFVPTSVESFADFYLVKF